MWESWVTRRKSAHTQRTYREDVISFVRFMGASGQVLAAGRYDTLLDFDVRTQSLAKSMAFGTANYVALALSKEGRTLYAVGSGGKVDRIDAPSFAVTASITAGVEPFGLALSADGAEALLTDAKSKSGLPTRAAAYRNGEVFAGYQYSLNFKSSPSG